MSATGYGRDVESFGESPYGPASGHRQGSEEQREESAERREPHQNRCECGRRHRDDELAEIDRIHALAARDKARSDYVNSPQVEQAMRTRETGLDGVLSGYLTARSAAQPKVAAATDSIGKILEKLSCMIDNEVEVQRLHSAWGEVRDRLHDCTGTVPVCIDDNAEFDHKVEGVDIATLNTRKAAYDARVGAAETRFDALVTEPVELPKRVTKLQTDVTALLTALGEDPATADNELNFAKALVAQREAAEIWLHFPSASDFEGCLRRCLHISVQGRRALTEIVGELARHSYWENKRRERCESIKQHLAEEIVAEAEEIAKHEHHRQ